LLVAEAAVLQRFPVKSMGGERLESVDVLDRGLVGDREWAVYGADGKLASGKHSARFRRMDPVFELVARRDGDHTVVLLPDGAEHVAGEPGTDDSLSQYFDEPVWLRRETDVMHQDQATFSLVGTATLVELGHHEGDGRPVDPRHIRANLVVQNDQPYAEESWIGREITVGTVRVRVTEAIQRCRMVGVAQVGLPERPGMLRAISDHHDLLAGVYATVLRPGRVAVGDGVRPA
jgi:uncharacterized protein YcbX